LRSHPRDYARERKTQTIRRYSRPASRLTQKLA